MARSLFEELRAQAYEAPPPPRLQANWPARLARFSWRNAVWVVLAWALVAGLCLGLGLRSFSQPVPEKLAIPISAAPAAGDVANFARLDNLQTITLSNPDPQLLAEQRADLVQTLRQHKEIYELVFAPGTGDYYDSHGLLYHPLDEIKGRVAYALSLKPLFTAVSQAPNASSMATLVSEIAAAIKQGRDPQGVDDLLAASAASVQALMSGNDKPVDWAKVADLDSDNTSTLVTVLALPKPHQSAAANSVTLKLLNILRSTSGTIAELSKSDAPEDAGPVLGIDWPRAAASFLIGAVFAGLVLALCLGRARLVLVIAAPVVAVGSVIVAGLLALAGPAWLSYWPLGLGLVVIVAVLSLHFALAVVEQAAGRHARELSVMMAAQLHGAECLWLAGLMAGPWAGLLALRAGLLTQMTLAALAIIGLGLFCVFTLAPALFRLLPQAAKWRAREWLVPAHRALFETGQWQFLARALGGLLVAAAVAVIFLMPAAQTQAPQEGPVTLIASSQADAEANITRLQAFHEAQGVRWLAMFLPEGAAEKGDALRALKDQFPRITPVESEPVDDLRDDLDTLQESLKEISEAAAAKPDLKQAADDFRRSLALISATSGDSQIRQLENRLFGGFNRLADRADELAQLDAPNLNTLPPELGVLFGTPDKALRIEVIAAPGVSNAALALSLEKAGFNVLHPAVAQQDEATARLKAILLVIGLGAGISCLLLMGAFGNAAPLTAAGVNLAASIMVLLAAERLWHSEWTLPWLLSILLVLSSQMAALFLTPSTRGSTAVSAIEVFMLPAVALALVVPSDILGVNILSESLVPPALGLGIVAVITGLLQQHKPRAKTEEDVADLWPGFET